MPNTTSLLARTRATPAAKRDSKAGTVKFALYRRGNPKFRNFHAIIDESVMQAAGLQYKDPCDLRFSEDMTTCEIVKADEGPSVTIQQERNRGVMRTRLNVGSQTPEFETSEAQIVRTGDHAVIVKVPPKVARTLKALRRH